MGSTTPVLGILLILCMLSCIESTTSKRPNVVFILGDDIGWNDVSFHGSSSQTFTPNMDALAYSGVILNRYYVSPVCTPSRAALMTGKYPIHTGTQDRILYGNEPRGLPINEVLLPQYLKELGYSNHMLGKWHLGFYKKIYAPLSRGFDSHLGFWTANQDQFDHTSLQMDERGLDMRRNWDTAPDLAGNFTTDLLTDEATKIISNHSNGNKPLFLFVSQAAAHSGNSDNRLPVPAETLQKFMHIPRGLRRRYAASIYHLDLCVGAIVEALQEADMLQNTIIIFSTDNGGPTTSASNFPLRSEKGTLWEGGVRGTGFIWSPLIRNPQRVSNQMVHISDWLPTILGAVGGNFELKGIDGINQWDEISSGMQSKRTEILHNLNQRTGISSITVDKFKLVQGSSGSDTWSSIEGDRNATYDTAGLFRSKTAVSLSRINQMPDVSTVLSIRAKATINCNNKVETSCNPAEKACLFNIDEDPCEYENLADQLPEVLQSLTERLRFYNATALPPGNLPRDPRGNPSNWNNTWTNFGDFLNLP